MYYVILWKERELGAIRWNYVVTRNKVERDMMFSEREEGHEFQKIIMFSGLRDLYNFLDDVSLLRNKIVSHERWKHEKGCESRKSNGEGEEGLLV
jgi:hypothetical protein